MSTALKARGTKIQVDPGGGFANITNAKDIQFANPTTEEIDYTNQDSPANSKEFLAGDIDYGTVAFQVNYLPTDARHIALIADQAAGTARSYRVLLPSPSSLAQEFTAYVQTVQRNAPVNGVLTMDVTLRVTGAPVEDTTP